MQENKKRESRITVDVKGEIGKEMFDKMDFRRKPNNWLKMHGKPMRRKPFKRESTMVLIDEGYHFLSDKTAVTYVQETLSRMRRNPDEKENEVLKIDEFSNIGLKKIVLGEAGDHIIPYSPIPTSGQINGTTTPDNLQMLCHSCNLDKLNKPFDKVAEERRLQEIYSMTDDEIAALPEGGKD